MGLFGTNGIRGRIDELTPELALGVSAAFAEWTAKKYGKEKFTIVLGRDMRNTGELLREAVVAGLVSAGADVVDLGIVSSPTVEWFAKKSKADGAIIITASHNPPEWNALKFVDGKGVAVSAERGNEIERLMGEEGERSSWKKTGKTTVYGNAMREHIDAIVRYVDAAKIQKRKLKLVLDCGNGTACLLAPELFRELGCEAKVLNGRMDGTFPGRPSEPTAENLRECIAAVKREGADLGIAWDGDCDRVIFIDERGEWIVGDRGFALSALLALRERKGKVVTTVATSNVVADVCRKYGGELIYTKVGAPYLSERVRGGKGVVSAGEEVGGIIWPEFSLAKDGFLAAAKICEALCERKMAEWLAELPVYFNAKTKIECKPGQKKSVLGALEKLAREKGLRVNTLDGVRVDFESSWVIVRASGTENYFRVFAEARGMEGAERLMKEYEGKVRELMKG